MYTGVKMVTFYDEHNRLQPPVRLKSQDLLAHSLAIMNIRGKKLKSLFVYWEPNFCPLWPASPPPQARQLASFLYRGLNWV